ncbi:MAG: hypothetical protein A2521_13770 [Deltaproteobacteria bacterium RIFOXYD12_FULL_57_12]|nr:MAG: hypothetical protein A2521_13770 [Deltaproteobacteria bacterium RIFOXYD12_FULL_57_12]
MAAAKDFQEQRKTSRFSSKGGVVAVLMSETGKLVGSLVDISQDGIRFNYIDLDKELHETSRLRLNLRRDTTHVDNIPCRLVWDRATAPKSPFNVVQMRERAVQFDKAPADLFAMLRDLIESGAGMAVGCQPPAFHAF